MVHSKNQAAMQNSSQADKKGFRFWKTMQREQKKLLNRKENRSCAMKGVSEKIKSWWERFQKKRPRLAKWVYQIGCFFGFSMGVTVFQYLVFTFMPGILGTRLAGIEFMYPQIPMKIFGVEFTWSLIGYNVLTDAVGAVKTGGGLGYLISYETGSFLAQCINFPLQRNITFKSKGNPWYQALWYFLAWVVISLVCNGFNNLWMPVAAAYVPPAVYNLLVTFVTGGVSMGIFFFVFKIIFPEGEKKETV